MRREDRIATLLAVLTVVALFVSSLRFIFVVIMVITGPQKTFLAINKFWRHFVYGLYGIEQDGRNTNN